MNDETRKVITYVKKIEVDWELVKKYYDEFIEKISKLNLYIFGEFAFEWFNIRVNKSKMD